MKVRAKYPISEKIAIIMRELRKCGKVSRLRFSPEKLEIVRMDKRHVMIFRVEIGSEEWSDYECLTATTIAIKPSTILDFLSTVPRAAPVTFEVSDTDILSMRFFMGGGDVRTCIAHKVPDKDDDDDGLISIPPTEHDVEFDMAHDLFFNALARLKQKCDQVRLRITNSHEPDCRFIMSSYDPFSDLEFSFNEGPGRCVTKRNCSPEISEVFSVEYLSRMKQLGTFADRKLLIKLKESYPVVIQAAGRGLGTIEYHLAPVVTDDSD